MFITELSIRRPVVSWVMSLILIIFGIFVFFVQLNSKNENIIDVLTVKDQVNLTDLSFFLKDESGSTYVGGNGFGDIGMQMMGEEASGINILYNGENEDLKSRAEEISNDDGSTYPVKYLD